MLGVSWAKKSFITELKDHKFPFRTPERPTSVHEHHIYVWESTTYVNRTYSRTYWFIYIDSRIDILYYYTQLVLMNCTSVYTTHINGIHTHTRTLHFIYIDSCTDILYYCTHLVQMDSTFVYTTVHIRLYCKFVPTNESPSKITLMNRVDQSQLRFLDIPLPPLNHSMLTTSFP